MHRKYRLHPFSITLLLISMCLVGIVGTADAAARVPSGPQKLTVVAGYPFEPVPSSGSSKISVTLCPEETEPVTFTARYKEPLLNVRVAAAGDFVGPGTIQRLNIQVSRVDGDKLVNDVSRTSGAVYALADLGPEPTQFWVNVTVPRRTPPGTYKGAIGFYYQNKTFDVVPLEVNVRPLRLLGSSKQYVLYTTYSLNEAADAQDYADFAAAFAGLGFDSMTVNADAEQIDAALQIYKQAGFARTVPISIYADGTMPAPEDISRMESAVKSAGLPGALYLCKSFPSNQEEADFVKDQVYAIRGARGKAIVTVSDGSVVELLTSRLHGINYNIGMPYIQSLIAGEKQRSADMWEWYWWDAARSAWQNRIYAGVALWRSGLDGCMPFWCPNQRVQPDSLQGEALREGIDDTRYITTYMKALRELKDMKRDKDKEYIAATEAYLKSFMSKPLDQITPADLRVLRTKMAEFSITLAARL